MKLIFLVLIILVISAIPAAAETAMYAVNVGKGDAIIIRSDGCTALIDTGKGYACGRLRRAFEELEVDRLDAVFITHVDSDHIEGLQFLINSSIPVDSWYASPHFFEYKEKKHPLRKLAIEPGWLTAGDTVTFGDTEFTVLAPVSKNEDDEDDNSLVMMLSTPDGRILLTGDMENTEETELLSTGADLSCHILKVSNHGDGDATSDRFIQRAAAEYAVISTSSAEKPGTPDPGVVAALSAYGAQVLVTQDSHAVKCTLNDGSATAEHMFWADLPVYDSVTLSVDRDSELFTISNGSATDIPLKNWYIYSDAGNELFIFGDTCLPAGGSVILGTKSAEGEYDVYWDEKNVISNKKQDIITLYDENGNLIAAD